MTDQEWEELFDKYITEVVDDEQEHIKSHELPTAIKIRSLVSDSATQAAANKAAEEGGLPLDLMKQVIRDALGNTHIEDGTVIAFDQVVDELAIAVLGADRASRQVANKAEVEPVGEVIIFANDQAKEISSRASRTYAYVNDQVRKSMRATPPATTGASTARDQALEEAALICEGVNNYTNPMTANDCADSIRALKGSIGASTVLTDERTTIDTPEFRFLLIAAYHDIVTEDKYGAVIAHIDQHVAREVAAQAGQVAVPDDVARDAALWRECLDLSHGHSDEHGEFVMVQLRKPEGLFTSTADQFKAAVTASMVAAPSPAKESK